MVQLEDDAPGTLCLENNVLIHWTCQACAWQKSGRTRRARTVSMKRLWCVVMIHSQLAKQNTFVLEIWVNLNNAKI